MIEERIEFWFASQGWSPFEFQRRAWSAYSEGRSGLVHAPTGVGKTLSVWLGPVGEWLRENPDASRDASLQSMSRRGARAKAEPLRVIWVTPLRALAGDTVESLLAPIRGLGLPWTVEARTGDTSSSLRARQRDRLPTALVTTPESLSVLLSYPQAQAMLGSARCVVVDEWHELIGSKRGVQTELALARLRRFNPELRTWGLSATLGNVEEAARVLLGPAHDAGRVELIRGAMPKTVEIETLVPDDVERFPWSGHLGHKLADEVVARIDRAGTTLLFTNTRSQAEIWFRLLLTRRPDWIGQVAIHHGSIDSDIRAQVERLLRGDSVTGSGLRCVVCTSSLDLGVDFAPVDQVIQVGSPKGVARLMQRAGRSGHRPGATSRIVGVPTHAFELVEFAAVRRALEERCIESRVPVRQALDVLVQHLVTVAAGGGFEEAELLDEVRSTHAFAELSEKDWRWAMDFVRHGGPALTAYPHYARVGLDGDRCTIASQKIARMHRLAIGTITSDPMLQVRFLNGTKLGTIEEGFIARLSPGDRFAFAGRVLELLSVHGMTAYVQRATRKSGVVPRWNGGKLPLSTQLADAVRDRLDDARRGLYQGVEMESVRPLLELQKQWSALPGPDELLIESVRTRAGHHAFVYPFAGRLVHEGIAAIASYRLVQRFRLTVTATTNDYGFELLTNKPVAAEDSLWRELLSVDRLVDDLVAALNSTELARRQFRDIARVAGLILPSYPSERKSMRHLQASADLFYDVFHEFDPGNLLLDQARREVLENQLEIRRLRATLEAMSQRSLRIERPRSLTPMSFPLFAEHLRETHASSENWEDRVREMVVQLEREAGRAPGREGARVAVA